jgi:hypothetical protein
MSTVSNAASIFSTNQVNTTSSSSSSPAAQAVNSSASQQLAGNFDTLLQLLTTKRHRDRLTLKSTQKYGYSGHGGSCIQSGLAAFC